MRSSCVDGMMPRDRGILLSPDWGASHPQRHPPFQGIRRPRATAQTADNTGGMRCTVQKDAYHTVSAFTFMAPPGAVIDMSRPDAEKAFVLAEPRLTQGSLELRRELLADSGLIYPCPTGESLDKNPNSSSPS